MTDHHDVITLKPWYSNQVVKDPFLVPTPKPYAPAQPIDDTFKAQLLDKAAKLWEAIRMLDISPMDAYQREYTLNRITTENLMCIALQAGKLDAATFIRKHLD
jgi:hypothetical protein